MAFKGIIVNSAFGQDGVMVARFTLLSEEKETMKINYLENIGKPVFNIVSANKRVITEKQQEMK